MSTSTPPEGSGPEFLEQGAGTPVGTTGDGGGSGRRTALLAGAGIVGLAAVGTGVWAAMSFFGTGPQPAEALPAGTIGYASLDLDPSGGQKIEAFRMLRKFPAIKTELDKIGLTSADEDIKRTIFEQMQEDGTCEDLDYDDDVASWLGDRYAVAAVDLGEDTPTPVVVVQVKDAGAAEDGLAAFRECGSAEGADTSGGWAVDGDWAVIAETEEQADQVVAATNEGTLADDSDFQDWTDEVGDAGVVTMYAAPEAGEFLAEAVQQFSSPLAMSGMTGEELSGNLAGDDPAATPALPDEVLAQLEDFQGAAATIRFDDGALEFEVAGEAVGSSQIKPSEEGAGVVTTLPADTAVAFGFGLADGWGDYLVDTLKSYGGPEGEDMLAQLEAQSGLTIPDDLETLLGESAAISLSGSFDPEAMVNSTDGSDVPVGVKVKGDAAAIDEVLSKLAAVSPAGASVLESDAEDGYVAIGPDSDYRSELLGEGGLGDSDEFQNVVREGDDASMVLYVNFNAGDWLTNLASGDETAQSNLEPLQGFGFSVWTEDEVGHGVVRLTTDD